MSGLALTGGTDPFAAACARAAEGCDAGLVTYNLAADRIGAALVLAPEVPLARAMAMLPLAMVGFQNAFGNLAPPEVALFLDWRGQLWLNGGHCGTFRAAASTRDPAAVPGWLVVGFELPLLPADPETGNDPDRTVLAEEGCGDIDPAALVEAWARHTLNWIARWEDEGNAPLHAEWSGLAHGIGGSFTVGPRSGTFLGVDEDFGLLLKDATTTRLIPLTDLLGDPP